MRTTDVGRLAGAALGAILLLLPPACSPQPAVSRERASRNTAEMWDRIGRELAALAARQPHDGRVLLIREPDRAGLEKGHMAMSAAFETAFRSRAKGRPEVVVVETPVERLPDQIGIDNVPGPSLTPAWLGSTLQKQGPAVLIVSLTGEPVVPVAGGARCPPIVCFARDGATNLSALIRSGVVVGAVAPRHTDPAKGEKDWFELQYTVVTPENVGTW